MLGFAKGFGRFWYDFLIGDDWKIAAAVLLVLAIGAALVMAGLGGALLAPVLAVGVAVAFTGAILLDVRSR